MSGNALQSLDAWFLKKIERHFTDDFGRQVADTIVANTKGVDESVRLLLAAKLPSAFSRAAQIESARTFFQKSFPSWKPLKQLLVTLKDHIDEPSMLDGIKLMVDAIEKGERFVAAIEARAQQIAPRRLDDNEIESILTAFFGGAKGYSDWMQSLLDAGIIGLDQTKEAMMIEMLKGLRAGVPMIVEEMFRKDS